MSILKLSANGDVMKIYNILKTSVLTTAVISGLNSCERKSYKLVPQENIQKNIRIKLDSFSRESKKILKNTSYEFYDSDMIKLDSTFETNTNKFINTLKNRAQKKNDKVIEYSRVMLTPLFYENKSEVHAVIRHKYTNKYLSPKVVLKKVQLYTTDNKDKYIQVEYFGIANPKVSNKK